MHIAIDRLNGALVRVGDTTPESWDRGHRGARPWGDGTWRFACPGCGGDVAGRSSWDPLAQRRPHFAHRRRSACPWALESDAHRRIKAAVLAAALAAGWRGSLEEPGPGYVADVLVEEGLAHRGPTGWVGSPHVVYAATSEEVPRRRVAFEVQLQRQGPARTNERTARYQRAGIEVVWLLGWRGVRAQDHRCAVTVIDGDVVHVVVPTRRGPMTTDLESFVSRVLTAGLQRAPSPLTLGRAELGVAPLVGDGHHGVGALPLPVALPARVAAAPLPGVTPTTPFGRPSAREPPRPSFWRRLAALLLGPGD